MLLIIEMGCLFIKTDVFIYRNGSVYLKKWVSIYRNGCVYLFVMQSFNATRHLRHTEAVAIVMYMYLYTSLSWINHALLVPLSVTKHRPVHFILNQGHVEYELGILMV